MPLERNATSHGAWRAARHLRPADAVLVVSALVVGLLVVLSLFTSVFSSRHERNLIPRATPFASEPLRLFDTKGIWNTQLPPDATLDPSSAVRVRALDQQIEQASAAGLNPLLDV